MAYVNKLDVRKVEKVEEMRTVLDKAIESSQEKTVSITFATKIQTAIDDTVCYFQID